MRKSTSALAAATVLSQRFVIFIQLLVGSRVMTGLAPPQFAMQFNLSSAAVAGSQVLSGTCKISTDAAERSIGELNLNWISTAGVSNRP